MRHLMNLYNLRLGGFATQVCVSCLSTPKKLLAMKKDYSTSLPVVKSELSAMFDKFPSLRTKKASPDGVYILQDHVTDCVISHLGTNLTDDGVAIIEANPGPGVLTSALLKAGATKFRVIEPKKEYHDGLCEIQDRVSIERLQVIKADFFKLSKLAYMEKHMLTNITENIFKGIPVKSWYESTPPCIVVGTAPPARESVFFSYLPVACFEMKHMYNLGRVQLLLFITDKKYKTMVAKPGDGGGVYRAQSILSQLFFDIELLHKEDRSNFFPPLRNTASHFDLDHLYLVKITPKDTLMNLLPTPEALRELHFFIRQHCYKKSDFVIKELENWIPNCGVRLIKIGFKIFTQFKDLSPSQFLHLFLEFSSWPEYPTCSFRMAVRKWHQGYDLVDDDDDDVNCF